jgi:hypothetical protein
MKNEYKKYIKAVCEAFLKCLLIVIGVFLATFVAIFFINFLSGDKFLESLTGTKWVFAIGENHKTLTANELKSLDSLIANGHILTQDQLLNIISQFYNNIITILVVVISILGFLAYLSIKSLSRNHAEEIAEKLVTKEVSYFLSDDRGINNLLNKSSLIQELSGVVQQAAQDRKDLMTRLEQLESRIIGLEFNLMGKAENPEKTTLQDNQDGNNKKK